MADYRGDNDFQVSLPDLGMSCPHPSMISGLGSAPQATPPALLARMSALKDAVYDYIGPKGADVMRFRIKLVPERYRKEYIYHMMKVRAGLTEYESAYRNAKLPLSELSAYVGSQELVWEQFKEIIESDIKDATGKTGDVAAQSHMALAQTESLRAGDKAVFANAITTRTEQVGQFVSEVGGVVKKGVVATGQTIEAAGMWMKLIVPVAVVGAAVVAYKMFAPKMARARR